MKKQQATQLVIQNPPKRDSPSNTIPAVNIVPKFSSTSKEKMPISVPPSSEGISKPLLSPASRAVLRLSGLMETPWPDAQQRHVRQRSPDMAFQSQIGTKYRTERKLKTRKVEITAAEDLLENLSKSLHIETCMKKLMEPNFREEEYFRVSSTLKLPRRAIMTGSRLQDEIRKRTVTRLPYPGPATIPESREDSVASDVSEETEKKRLHSALEWLYRLLYTIVTPFDIGAHESLLWTHKYAPQCSADVLQVGREMEVLRDWMQKLAVDSGSEVPGNPKKKKRKQKNRDGAGNVATNAKGGRRKKKRKRTKGDGLDDFLVDTDEEQDEMDEITDPEDNGSTGVPGIFSAQSKKSAIRTGDKRASLAAQLGYVPDGGLTAIGGGENGKMVNAVVISGPHGCGKTAAVYAVAKEMGYQVFEVNPGTRRSGKDILDQVGEMSKNHLVHQQKVNPLDPNFFQNTKNRRKNKKQVEELIEKAQQTQSLILLEEVDLLYEEDKQFWATVMTLMGQSKRPIVMTCNDESLLPIDDLSLHAILRLSAPPEDLAVDYLLLMAANEGHLLQRSEVSALYNTMKGDLRAMIMELNFWCQMGIGDRRAGLDWILQRFPVGCDIDDNGERKRVISENTYIGGMGWVPKKEEDDGVTPQESTGRMLGEDDIWKSVWEEWCIDVGTDGEGPMRGMEGWTEQIGELKAYEHKRLASHAFSVYAEALSDADVYAGPGMRTLENPILDPTQPKRSPSSTIDDLLGYTMLQTDPWPSNPTSRGTFTSLATCIRSLARCFLASETNALLPPSAELTMLTPQRIVQAISARFRTERETASIPAQYIQSAFTHLAAPPATTTALSSTSSSGASISGTAITTTSIHGPLPKLVLDIAPYTRAIVRYDQKREEARIKTSNLLSAGGNGGREARRSTRAARLAMEGGDRGAGRGRKERYFLRGNARWMVSTGERVGEKRSRR
ncbi:hypothetical protein BDZ91DRAFT_234782 [Kalaharituber pfeilii]|nr:hypothetical protein BDZ91DRAFT_234782 [Kalaharituber pfeilii]